LRTGRWYQRKVYPAGGFRTILNLQKLFQGRGHLFGLDRQPVLFLGPGRLFSHAAALAVLAAASLLAACNAYNPNLGAPPTYSSQITYLAPSAKVAGQPAFTLTFNGAGFVSGSTVQWAALGQNGSNLDTTYVSTTAVAGTQLTASVPAADIANPGTYTVVVISPGANNGNNRSNVVPFTVDPPPSSAAASASAKDATAALPGSNYTPAISADHRYVAFAAVSADPSTDASTGLTKIYLRDTCAGVSEGCTPQTILVSVGPGGAQPDGASRSPSISADGRFVAFASDSTNLVTGDTNGMTDIFLRDTCINAPAGCVPQTTRISLGADGTEVNGPSSSPSISPDGRFIAFDSAAGNLVLDGSSAPTGAFLRDTCFGAPAGCVPQTTRLAISPPPPQ
jgi:WD40-like Beta Propeller Repeat